MTNKLKAIIWALTISLFVVPLAELFFSLIFYDYTTMLRNQWTIIICFWLSGTHTTDEAVYRHDVELYRVPTWMRGRRNVGW